MLALKQRHLSEIKTVLTNNNGYVYVAGSGGNGAELRFHKKSDKSLTYSIKIMAVVMS